MPLFVRPRHPRPHGLVVPLRRDGVVLPVLCWWPAAADVSVRAKRVAVRAARMRMRPDRPLWDGLDAQTRAKMWRELDEAMGLGEEG